MFVVALAGFVSAEAIIHLKIIALLIPRLDGKNAIGDTNTHTPTYTHTLIATTDLTHLSFCFPSYHRIIIRPGPEQLVAVVDDVYTDHSHIAGKFTMLSSSRVYVGGAVNPRALLGARVHNNFVGCLRKVRCSTAKAHNSIPCFVSSHHVICFFPVFAGGIFCRYAAVESDRSGAHRIEADTGCRTRGLYVSIWGPAGSGYIHHARIVSGKCRHFHTILLVVLKSKVGGELFQTETQHENKPRTHTSFRCL